MLDPALVDSLRHTLFAGKYNLLLGSGVSLNSRDRSGAFLRGTEQLRKDICALTNTSSGTSLSRAYSLLTPQQRQTELVRKYSNCQPGAELRPFSRCLWKRIFTFNIDDVVEALHDRNPSEQRLTTLNFDSAFEPDTNLSELQCIHLHGYAGQPASGFVFSHTEYVRMLNSNNPWMLLLSEILPSESFIIAGTSFNEVDLQYYLARRTSSTPRRGRGPSLLIEPNPDAATFADCERYNLTLVRAGFGDFLAWLDQTFPNRPSVRSLIVPPIEHIFRSTPSPPNLLRFFSDFELVHGRTAAQSTAPKPYMYGSEPTWPDIEEHLDVERGANQIALDRLTVWFDRPSTKERVLLFSDAPATGKSTLLKRVGHDLASLGRIVLNVRTLARLDIGTAARCLSQLTSPCVILVDNFADYAEQICELLDETTLTARVAVMGAERSYRKEYIDIVLSNTPVTVNDLGAPTTNELDQLLETYQRSGLIGDNTLTRDRQRAITRLRGEPIAISVCRILNDFRPLDRIVDSLWEAADARQREVYLACALAQRCHGTGVRQTVLQMIAGSDYSVDSLLGAGCPLPLARHPSDDDFLLPQSAIIAERVLGFVSRGNRDLMIKVFTALAHSIAPRVNRRAIRLRTPEARLAGRLFDGDKIVRPLLEERAEAFYVAVKESWKWNSRYWEQRALLITDRDIRTALQFARHAVTIEDHPLPLTTLGKVLLKSLSSCGSQGERANVFAEAFSVLGRALAMEVENARVTIHPFSTLLTGTSRFLVERGSLTLEQYDAIRGYMADARYRYGEDKGVAAAVERLDRLM